MNEPKYQRAALVSEGMDGAATRKALQRLVQELKAVPPAKFNADRLRSMAATCARQPGTDLDALEHALRVAITGDTDSPDVYSIMERLGKEGTLGRIDRAIMQLSVVATI